MFKDIKKLKKLLRLKEENEAQIRIEGFTPETLKDAVEKQRNKMVHELNGIGWLLVFLIIIPLALTGLGMSIESAAFISYISGGIIIFILHGITGRYY